MAFLSTLGAGVGGDDASLNVESTTRVSFNQTAAPTGWTKSVTHNDKILRVVSGTAANGGTQAFSTVFGPGKSSSSHTLSTPQIPSHAHTYPQYAWSGQTADGGFGTAGPRTELVNRNTPSSGGSGSHSHSLSLDIQYVDVILAEKD